MKTTPKTFKATGTFEHAGTTYKKGDTVPPGRTLDFLTRVRPDLIEGAKPPKVDD